MELEDRIRGYAADAVADCRPGRITAVTRFDAGNRHAVFRVSYSTDASRTSDLVVRASLRVGSRACADANWEAAVIAAAGGVGAPRLHDVRCESPWFAGPVMCLAFVPGEARDLTDAAPADLEALGVLLRRVHGVPTHDLRKLRPAPSTLDAYLTGRHADIVAKLALLPDVPPTRLRNRVDRARALVDERLESARRTPSFAEGRSDALLHGDPGAGNVLWTPAPVLIDWEYARLGDPADEVGYLFGQLGCTTAQRQAFWRGYCASTNGGDADEDLVERVRTWEPLTLLGSALWWLERWSARTSATSAAGTARSPAYELDEAVQRLDRLDALLA